MILDARLVSTSRGYYVYTGISRNIRLTIASLGIGGPQLAIGIEELAHMGAHNFIKIGPAWPISSQLHTGDLVLPVGVYRGGATAQHYLPLPFPAVPDFKMARITQETAARLNTSLQRGLSVSMDAIFPPISEQIMQKCQATRTLTLDMDTDTFYVMSSNYGWRSLAMQVVYSQSKIETVEFIQGEANAVAIACEVFQQLVTEDAAGTLVAH
jgi:uridine phosphorylase